MKILQVINSLSAGGAETFVVSLSEAMALAGHEVVIYCYAGVLDKKGVRLRNRLKDSSVVFYSDDLSNNILKLSVPIKLRQIIKTFKPDIVHAHLTMSEVFTFLAVSTMLTNKPRCIRTVHSVYASKRFPAWFHLRLMEFFDLSIACGDLVMQLYPFSIQKKVSLINNGICLKKSNDVNTRNVFRKKLGISESSLMFINVGSFYLRNDLLPKSQDLMVDAMAEFGQDVAVLVLVGDGEKRSIIEAQASRLGLKNRIIFTGLVDNTEDYINAADVVLMPSRFEGLSIACIEAVTLGKPIIASDISAFHMFNSPATTLIPVDDVNALVNAMRGVVKNLPELSRLASEEVIRYQEQFDIKKVATRYLDEYESVDKN